MSSVRFPLAKRWCNQCCQYSPEPIEATRLVDHAIGSDFDSSISSKNWKCADPIVSTMMLVPDIPTPIWIHFLFVGRVNISFVLSARSMSDLSVASLVDQQYRQNEPNNRYIVASAATKEWFSCKMTGHFMLPKTIPYSFTQKRDGRCLSAQWDREWPGQKL
jgi:hypothetical protein